jgi:hypothetical protein
LKAAETTTALLIAIVRKQDFPSKESIVLMPNRIASAGKAWKDARMEGVLISCMILTGKRS